MLNIKKRLITLPNSREAFELLKVFEQFYNNQSLTSVVPVAGGAVATWSTTNASVYLVNGTPKTVAALATQAVPAAAALIATGYQNVAVVIGQDAQGATTTYVSAVATSATSAADALSKLVFPQIPDGIVVIGGFIIQSNATAFVPATTLFNAAGITTIVFSTVGPFFPVSPV
jgi:hypothetical protein